MCVDEVSGVSFDQKDGVNIMKGYFVATPEFQSEDSIGSDPLPAGQLWTVSPGGGEDHPGLYRLDMIVGSGSGVKILNAPVPPPFRGSVKYAEQDLYARSKELVGDCDPREREFSIQLRAFDAARTGSSTGLGTLLALCSRLLQKSLCGGLVVVGQLNLGGSIDPVFNAVNVAELAVEKGATTLLVPISARRQLMDLSDDMAARLNIQFCTDARDALLKGLLE